MRFLLPLLGSLLFLFCSSSVVGQTDTSRYDERVFSEGNRLKLDQLIQYMKDSVPLNEAISIGYIEMRAQKLEFSFSNLEKIALAYHPNIQIRAYFLPHYTSLDQEESNLFDYLNTFITYPEIVATKHGCLIYTNPFGELCYHQIYPKLSLQHQAFIDLYLLETGVLEDETVKLIKKLPKDSATYLVLKQLVVEKKKFFALHYLLDFGDLNDRLLVFNFLETDRTDAHFIMMTYPSATFLPYFKEMIPHYLNDNWNYDISNSYFFALQQFDSVIVQSVISDILQKMVPNKRYRNAASIYATDWFNKASDSIRMNTLITLFPSLESIDSVDIQLLAESNPRKFDQLVENQLKEVEKAYENPTAKNIFHYYMEHPTPEKHAICKYVLEHSRGAELWEAYLHFSEYDSISTATILLKRFYEEHPHPEYPSILYKIMECISDLGDRSLSAQIAPTIIEDLFNCKHISDVFVYLYIIKLAEDERLIEQLIQNLEKVNFDRCEMATCRFLLEFFDEGINELLLANYKKLISSNTITNYEEFQLKEYLLQYGVLKE